MSSLNNIIKCKKEIDHRFNHLHEATGSILSSWQVTFDNNYKIIIARNFFQSISKPNYNGMTTYHQNREKHDRYVIELIFNILKKYNIVDINFSDKINFNKNVYSYKLIDNILYSFPPLRNDQ
jgi:hypothetical protein